MKGPWSEFWEAVSAGDAETARKQALAGAAQAVDHSGDTGLIRAAKLGRTRCVHALLEASNANAAGKDGRTALMAAANGGRREIVEILLSKSGVDLFLVDHAGENAREIAERGRRWGCSSVLRARMEAWLLEAAAETPVENERTKRSSPRI